MKENTSFFDGCMGPEAIATKPIGEMKYMDWEKVQQIVDENPDAVIHAGLKEDWNNTSGLIYAKGKYYNGGSLYDRSVWATPIVDVDGKEIECWTYEKQKKSTGVPRGWGKNTKIKKGQKNDSNT